MGNSCVPGYYKLAEVDDLDNIIPHVFSEEEDDEARVSSQETLLVQRRTEVGKTSNIQLRSSRYRKSSSAPQMRPYSGRSRKSRRKPLRKRSKMISTRNTESRVDFRAINSLICNKTPIVFAFLGSETKLHIKNRNRQIPSVLCSRCKKATQVYANEFQYGHQHRSLQSQNSRDDSHPCARYCKSCKVNAFPCADYCRACSRSVSQRSSKQSYHRHYSPIARTSPSRHIKISD